MAENPNIAQRLNAIKKAVAYVQKDKEVTGAGSYMAVTHDAITAATRVHFVEHGVLVLPSEISGATVDSSMVTGKGNPIIRFEAKYRIDFVNVDEMDQKVSIEITAHALDQGDKAPGKALSYATKAAVLKVLQIETGVDDEGREVTKPKDESKQRPLDSAHTPTDGAGDGIPPERKAELDQLFSRLVDFMDSDDILGGHDAFYALTDSDEMTYVWGKLKPHSKFRREIKNIHKLQEKK